MINKYIYASSSDYDLISDELKELKDTPKTLVFVPSSKIEYPFRLTQEAELIDKLDLNLREVISLVDEVPNWPEIISRADILYLHGGNPLVFKEYLQEKQVWELIQNFKGTIIGISAGSMLMSQNIALTPSNEEYTQLILEPAYGFSSLNIFPHMNYQEVMTSQTVTGDGVMRISDLFELSKTVPIDLLADNHFIIQEKDELKYIGDYFYRIDNERIYSLIDNEWIELDYQDNSLDQSVETNDFERLYNSMDEAIQNGCLATHFNDKSFSFFGIEESLELKQQLDLPQLKTWIIEHPEFRYATLSLIQINERVLERLTFRTRYLKFFEQWKVWPKLL